MENTYDAIVIGGGHNGLISGAFFAKGGARTVIVEARDKVGGAADTSSPWPDHADFKVTTYSYVMSLMPPTIIRELNLERHGYKVTPFGPYYQSYPDGRSIKIYADDAKKNYESISQFSKRDADTIPKWDAWLSGVASVLGPLLLQVPPKRGGGGKAIRGSARPIPVGGRGDRGGEGRIAHIDKTMKYGDQTRPGGARQRACRLVFRGIGAQGGQQRPEFVA